MIDGLDEAPEALRRELTASVSAFIAREGVVRTLITSRPVGRKDNLAGQLDGFAVHELADLTQSEVGVYIDRWCLAAELSLGKERALAEREAATAADDLKARIARSRPIQRIAVNPLLATILCVVHRFLGHSIPEHRATLYDKCTDALLYEWDRAKFAGDTAIGTLDAVAKRRLLMGVARRLHDAHAAELAESEVAEEFARVLPDLGRSPGKPDARRDPGSDRHVGGASPGVLRICPPDLSGVPDCPGLCASSAVRRLDWQVCGRLVARGYSPGGWGAGDG
ncbi:hypothetical protein [uncultured Thiodictyon sp.]|uniref:NACHT domain-containing protein n=1 Tax=uncultured Thiodictyon sp. TaxID=1846217 RepID=UPI0025E9216D|nr:hypothetical protein [uncultured Thiodictyon sp.]